MRHSFIALVSVFIISGCAGGPKVDDTPNQMSGAANYVPGPYGYAQGSVIENIQFIGKLDPAGHAGTALYEGMPMKEFSLADYHNDTAVKYVVLSGNAGWCKPCNDEQAFVPGWQQEFEPKGFRFLEALVQGYNARTGAPATEADIDRWQKAHDLHVAIGLDPQSVMFKYADVAAFPLNMIVRTSDMQIVYMQVGLQNLEDTLASLP
jgi:hypothetical protein